MTGPESLTMYCTLCGGPILQSGCYEDIPEWLSSTVMLFREQQNGQDGSSPADTIVEVPAELDMGIYFNLTSFDPPLYVTACDVEYDESEPPIYFPLHSACSTIFKEVAASSAIGSSRSSLFKVWKALNTRFLADPGTAAGIPRYCMNEQSGYYGVSELQDTQYSHRVGNSTGNVLRKCAEADPITIVDLTLTLLENLERLPDATDFDSSSTSTDSKLAQLPAEIIQSVLEELRPLSDSPQTSTYTIPPQYWKQALVHGSLIPWLPGLDVGVVEVMETKANKENSGWDWESLARHVAAMPPRGSVQELSLRGVEIPPGLANRRRIWQLVEDILISES